MKSLIKLASTAAIVLTLTAAAAPTYAAVFAQFVPDTNKADYRWIRSGGAGTGGHFFSINTNTATSAQGVGTHFSFLDPTLSALAFIPATFTIDATVANGHPASFDAATGLWTQTALSGHFSFVYTGATISNYMGSGINLVHNSNLLSGIFTDGWIQGAGGSGSTNLSIGNGGTASYSSDYEHFLHLTPASEQFAFNLLSVTPAFGAATGKAMNSFRANGGGNFSFQAVGVPEPAAWALMIAGFAGVGGVLRRQRRVALAA